MWLVRGVLEYLVMLYGTLHRRMIFLARRRYWTVSHARLCDRVLEDFDVKLLVSNEYFSRQFGCVIRPTRFIMNKQANVSYL